MRDDLSSGRLVAASGICVATGESYYLAERAPHEASPSAAAFRTWVLSQAAECAAKISPDIARDLPRRRFRTGRKIGVARARTKPKFTHNMHDLSSGIRQDLACLPVLPEPSTYAVVMAISV